MRMSVITSDPGYSPNAFMYDVMLNGSRITDCVTADVDRGYVVCFARDESDNLLISGDQLLYEQFFGSVQIILRSPY